MSNTLDVAVKAGLVTLARRGMVLAGDIRENQLDGVEDRGRLCRSNMRQTYSLGRGRERKRRRGMNRGSEDIKPDSWGRDERRSVRTPQVGGFSTSEVFCLQFSAAD